MEHSSTRWSVALVGVLCLVYSGFGYSATDGALGTSSTGSADVNLTIPELFKVSQMGDYSLGTYSGTGDLTGSGDVCVYHNGDGSYRVTITDTNTVTASTFAVENTDHTAAIPMSISWNDKPGTMGSQTVSDGVPLSARSGANTQASDCSAGGLSANMQIALAEGDLQVAPSGYYNGTVVVTVEAD